MKLQVPLFAECRTTTVLTEVSGRHSAENEDLDPLAKEAAAETPVEFVLHAVSSDAGQARTPTERLGLTLRAHSAKQEALAIWAHNLLLWLDAQSLQGCFVPVCLLWTMCLLASATVDPLAIDSKYWMHSSLRMGWGSRSSELTSRLRALRSNVSIDKRKRFCRRNGADCIGSRVAGRARLFSHMRRLATYQ